MKSEDTNVLRIGTRGSRLARWQAEFVAARLREMGITATLELIETTGDKDQVTDFGALGAKGIFVKEIETALLENRIDIAVHSLKDVPTALPQGLVLGAIMERESPFDGLVSRDGSKLDALPQEATIATGSLRRSAQILALRPDLKIVPIRGNVPTRVKKIQDGYADATLLALAGLRRLEMEEAIVQTFTTEEVTPAMGQGAMAIESRAGEFQKILSALNHAPTRAAVEAERVFLARIGGGCKTPVGILTESEEKNRWRLTGMLASADGASLLRETQRAIPDSDLNKAALELAERMMEQADESISATLHQPPHL